MQDVLYHLLWFATNIISRCSIEGSANPNSYYYSSEEAEETEETDGESDDTERSFF